MRPLERLRLAADISEVALIEARSAGVLPRLKGRPSGIGTSPRIGRALEEISGTNGRAEATRTIDAELAAEVEARTAAAEAVPPDLVSQYERLRTKLGGIGAARLVGNTCGGCHLALPATELDRIRHQPDDAVTLCDQCGRILVR